MGLGGVTRGEWGTLSWTPSAGNPPYRGVAREAVRRLGDGEVGGEALGRVDLKDVTPLGEPRALRVRGGRLALENVETLVGGLRVTQRAHL